MQITSKVVSYKLASVDELIVSWGKAGLTWYLELLFHSTCSDQKNNAFWETGLHSL